MATKYGNDPTASIILMVILAGVIFYLFSIPEVSRQEVLGDITTYENTFLSTTPGLVDIESVSTNVKDVKFPQITLDNTLKSESALLSSQFSVSAGVYSQDSETLTFNIADRAGLSEADIVFTISTKEGDGEMVLTLNGQKVYSGTPAVAEVVTIALPMHLLKEGINTVVFSTTSPGLKFWQSNSYLLTAVEFKSNAFGSNLESVSQTFSLSSDEVANAKDAEVTMFVTELSPARLNIKLNGATLFEGTPLSNFQASVPIELLKKGQNTFTFSTEEGGSFELNFIALSIDTETVEEGGTTYFFTIGSSDWDRVRSGAFACDMILHKTSGANTLSVRLNSYTDSYSFSEAEVKSDVCDKLKQGSNQITLSATEELDLSTLSVGITPN